MLVLAVIMVSCSTNKLIKNQVAWEDNIHNPENSEYVTEIAFNLEIPKDKVTQADFNNRYLTLEIMEGSKASEQINEPNDGSTVKVSTAPKEPNK